MTNEPKPTPRAELDDLAIIEAHISIAITRLTSARCNAIITPLASIGAITEAFQHAEIAAEKLRSRIHTVEHTLPKSSKE